ncbi:unnamed protein product [Heligmosomoides polygyrus]|uniref:Uncharacterized protein n=1 Tax=Heligmosomoides polygyrus TaxID=6339 RepID=A0A183GEK5_HELPZ|nr:unnamed protein product [Heligmosomoides polygyrus]
MHLLESSPAFSSGHKAVVVRPVLQSDCLTSPHSGGRASSRRASSKSIIETDLRSDCPCGWRKHEVVLRPPCSTRKVQWMLLWKPAVRESIEFGARGTWVRSAATVGAEKLLVRQRLRRVSSCQGGHRVVKRPLLRLLGVSGTSE